MSRLRLDEKEMQDFLTLSREDGFPCELTDEVIALLDKNIASNSFLLFVGAPDCPVAHQTVNSCRVEMAD